MAVTFRTFEFHLLIGFVFFCGIAGAQSALGTTELNGAEELHPGIAVSLKLGDASIDYWFNLESGHYFDLSLQKTGTDIALSIIQPDGRIVRSVPCSHSGPLHLLDVTTASGRFIARLKACEQNGRQRSVNLTLSPTTPASRPDRLRVAGQRLSTEADQLIAEYRAQSTKTAIRKYEEADRNWIALGDNFQHASALNRIARLHRDLGDLERSKSYANRALTVARTNKSLIAEAEGYLSLGLIYASEGNAEQALDAASKTLALARQNSDEYLEAEAQSFIGNTFYESLSDYEKATAAFQEADNIWSRLGNRIGRARTLFHLATVDFDLSLVSRGPEMAQQALTISRSLDDRVGIAQALTLLGHFQWLVGRNQEALNMYELARPIVVGSGDLSMEATILNSLARVHHDLGENQTALQFFEMALARNQELRDRVGIAYSLWLMGECYFAVGDLQKALSFLKRGLEAFGPLSNKKMEGRLRRQMGLVYEALGDVPNAFDSLEQSLKLSRSAPDQREEAAALATIGHLREANGQTDLALQYYAQAIELNRITKDPLGEVSTLYHIAHALRLSGKLEDSLSNSDTAIKTIEANRSNVTNAALRTSYFASVREQYELYIDVLMRLSREKGDVEAGIKGFEASERSRARTLLDTIAEARLSFSEGIDPQLLDREVSLKALLDTKAERYTQLLSTNASAKDVATLSGEIQTLIAEHEELQGQIRARSPRYAALVQPEPLRLDQIRNELLDPESLLLEYAIGDENSYLWAVSRSEFASFVLPKRSEIETKVRRLRQLMTSRISLPGEKPADLQARLKLEEAQYPQAAAELSQMLLGPVADRLGTRRLVIVAEGVLQYLPFGALPSPRSLQNPSPTPLVVEHDIVNLPSASTLAVIRREAPQRGTPDRTIAVFADPVFEISDPRVRKAPTRPSPGPTATNRVIARTSAAAQSALVFRGSDPSSIKIDLPRLTATRQEAEAIMEMVQEDSRMAALGFNATKAAAMSPELKRYRIVHFATHTILNENYPDLSSLVLSLIDEKGNPQNGLLRLRDMYNLQLAAELVVLSACDTGIGKEVKGEGLMSMVRGFMYSGTPRVLASLWKIDDEATAELMTEFYKNLLQAGMTPAASLRQAQIMQMQKRSRQSPYYWAGFQLQGEWN